MPFVICFRIDKWTESMLSITSSQECSIVQLVIPQSSSGTGTGSHLCVTATGTVANLQGLISLEEINHPRPLENSIFISTRISCISLIRM